MTLWSGVGRVILASHWSILLILASHWSGKEFPVHKTILSAEKINTDERYLETVFFGFSDEVTGTLLHYIYSQVSEYWPLIGQYWSHALFVYCLLVIVQSLPESLSPGTASQVMDFARNQPNFRWDNPGLWLVNSDIWLVNTAHMTSAGSKYNH